MEDPAPRQRIDSVRRGASGTAIVAAGGSSFTLRPDLAEELGLAASSLTPGRELEEAESSILSLAAEAYEAERRGLALLARAEQSSQMLQQKLEKRGFSPKAAKLATARLRGEGLLDDSRFAAAFAASRLSRAGSKAEGPASLSSALRARGIDRETAAEALAGLLGPEERREALEKAATKEGRKVSGDRDEIRRRLRFLGYRSDEIADYFDRHSNHP
jgi:regulatory protein